MSKTKQTALISGMHGFIGQHLANALKARNIEPIAIERDILYIGPNLKLFIERLEPHYIFHLAGFGNHGMQNGDDEIIAANIITTWNLLSASKDISYKAFINCSTSSIYGHQEYLMSEETAPKPDTFYAASKAGAMYLARAYAKQYDKPIVSVIPFSVFGPGEADWRYIPTICKHLVTGGAMPISGNQEQTHDWIYINNLIAGIMTAVENVDTLKGEWVNIGMGEKETNKEIRETLERIAGKKLALNIGGFTEQPHHSTVWVADNTKLQALGWKPKVSLEEGLKRTWEYYKAKYELKAA